MSFGVFGYTRYTQKYASAVFRAGGRISYRQLFLLDNFVYWLWLWNGDVEKWGLELEKTFEFIYPFMGGTAASHSFNLVDPTRGRITWVGGLTHDQYGTTGNGTSGYGKTGIKFAGNLSGGGAGVTSADTHVIFGCHVYNGTPQNAYTMGNWLQNIPSPPAPPGTVSTSYAGLNSKNSAGNAAFYNGIGAGVTAGPVPNTWGYRVCMRYADNGFVGYRSSTASAVIRVAADNTTTSAQGNEGQWCILISGEDDTIYSSNTIMGAFLTKSIRGSSPTFSYVYTDAKMNELWSDWEYFNRYMDRAATA